MFIEWILIDTVIDDTSVKRMNKILVKLVWVIVKTDFQFKDLSSFT